MRGLVAAAACLPVGFGVAAITGVRPLGGVVLLALALLAGRWSGQPLRRQATWYFVVLVCFIASHVIADALTSWGAVALVAAIATGAYWLMTRGSGRGGALAARRTSPSAS